MIVGAHSSPLIFCQLFDTTFVINADYLIDVCKGCLFLARRTRTTESQHKIIRNLWKKISTTKLSQNEALDNVQRETTLHIFKLIEAISSPADFYHEVLLLIICLLIGMGHLDLSETILGLCINDLLRKKMESILMDINEIYSARNFDFILVLIKFVECYEIDKSIGLNILDLSIRIASSRFDDDLNNFWILPALLTKTILSSFNIEAFQAICTNCIALNRLSHSSQARQMLIFLNDQLVDIKLDFDDLDGNCIRLLCSLFVEIYLQSEDMDRQWLLSNWVSTIRRLIPTDPLSLSDLTSKNSSGFSLNSLLNIFSMFRLLSKCLSSEKLCSVIVDFMINAFNVEVLLLDANLFHAFLETCFSENLKTSQRLKELIRTATLCLLEYCNETEMIFKITERTFAEEIKALSSALLFEITLDSKSEFCDLFHQIFFKVLHFKRQYPLEARADMISLLICLIDGCNNNYGLAKNIADYIYPLANSMVQSYFQLTLPSPWASFIQHAWPFILDLYSKASYCQVIYRIKSYDYFVTIYSPTSLWIASGKSVMHRRICAEIYLRWIRLDGNFFLHFTENVFICMFQCVLDYDQLDLLPAFCSLLNIPGTSNSAEILKQILRMTNSYKLQGCLQFVSAVIVEAPSDLWETFALNFIEMLKLIHDRRPDIFSDARIELRNVFYEILNRSCDMPMNVLKLGKILQASSKGLILNTLQKAHRMACLKILQGIWFNPEIPLSKFDFLYKDEILGKLFISLVWDNLHSFQGVPKIMELCFQLVIHTREALIFPETDSPDHLKFLQVLRWATLACKKVMHIENNVARIEVGQFSKRQVHVNLFKAFDNFIFDESWINEKVSLEYAKNYPKGHLSSSRELLSSALLNLVDPCMSFKSNPRTKNVTTNTLKMKRRDGIFNKEKLRSKLDVEFETIQQSKAARKTCVNDKGAKINKKHQVRIKQPLKQKDLEDSISNLESLMNK